MADFSFDITTPTPQAPEDGAQIFKQSNQPEWRVFVQAGPSGISVRRQLIKMLRQAGATIDIDPRAARVILVEPTTKEGRRLIRNWSTFTDKVVLNYIWVEKSLAAGKPLDAEANWGECLAEDDGLPIEEDYGEEESIPCSGNKLKREQNEQNVQALDQPAPTSTSQNVELPLHPLRPNAATSPEVPFQSTQQASLPAQFTPETLATQAMLLQNLTAQPSMTALFNAPQQAGTLQLTPEQQQLMVSLLVSHQFFGMSLPWNQLSMPTNGTSSFSPPPSGGPNAPPLQPQSSISENSDGPPTSPQKAAKQRLNSSKRKSTISTKHMREHESRSVSAGPSQSPHPTQGSLFISESGEPLSFFVQINLKDRRNIVGKIQKGGGKIVSDHVGADYAILSSQADHFNILLNGITAAGRQAHNVNFIHACFEENEVVDASPFAFDAPTGKKKPRVSAVKEEETSPQKSSRKRPPKDSPAATTRAKKPRSEPASPIQNNEQAVKEQRDKPLPITKVAKPPAPTKKPQTNRDVKAEKKTPEWKSTAGTSSGPRSPTPPPVEARRESVKGYYFTEEENDYAMRYTKILLNRDPEMTLTAICKALHNKMEHHSINSWMTHLGHNHKIEIAEMRKRASIAYRKRRSDTRPSTSMSVDSPAPATPESAKKQNNDFAMLLEEDLETVSKYFAFGGGDSGADEADDIVWRRLEDQVKCKTAISWQHFYGVHSEEVLKRFEKLVREEEEPAP